jgi:hypothetical protein
MVRGASKERDAEWYLYLFPVADRDFAFPRRMTEDTTPKRTEPCTLRA